MYLSDNKIVDEGAHHLANALQINTVSYIFNSSIVLLRSAFTIDTQICRAFTTAEVANTWSFVWWSVLGQCVAGQFAARTIRCMENSLQWHNPIKAYVFFINEAIYSNLISIKVNKVIANDEISILCSSRAIVMNHNVKKWTRCLRNSCRMK